jgi:hypothetical protein
LEARLSILLFERIGVGKLKENKPETVWQNFIRKGMAQGFGDAS